jgi:hypothetical protein
MMDVNGNTNNLKIQKEINKKEEGACAARQLLYRNRAAVDSSL